MSLRERLASALTKSNLWAALRTFLWIAPLTLLIWFNAASRTRQSIPNVRLTLDIRAMDPNLTVDVLDPPNGIVIVTVEGPAQAVDALGSDSKVSITLSENLSPGQRVRDTLQMLRQSSRFKNTGVTFSNPRPDNVTMKIDALIEREVAIRLPPSVQNATAEFTPAAVKVRGPSDIIRTAEAAGTLFVEAEVPASELAEPGRKQLDRVRLRNPLGPAVTISAEFAAANLEVRQTDVPLKLSTMSVFVPLPTIATDQYKISVEPSQLQNVTVWGPPEVIEAIRNKPELAFAQLALTPKDSLDLPIGTPRRAPITFVLPSGVRVDKADMERYSQAEWSAQRRDGAN